MEFVSHIAGEPRKRDVETCEPIQCALLANPSHRNDLMRFALLLIASLSVALLVTIALHYTQNPLVIARHIKLPALFYHRISIG